MSLYINISTFTCRYILLKDYIEITWMPQNVRHKNPCTAAAEI